jgi:hypothetical protein
MKWTEPTWWANILAKQHQRSKMPSKWREVAFCLLMRLTLLARSAEDSKDFGREVIEILVKELSNGPGDLAVIVAGYPKEMKTFLDSNPGLRSRFKLTFEFADYLPQELSLIADYASKEKEVALSPEAKLNGR